MRYLSLIILIAVCSCSKEPLPVRAPGPVSIQFLKAEAAGQDVVIQFRAFNTRNIAYYRLFSGDNGNLLCATGQIKNDPGQTDYIFRDFHPKGNPTYYILAYRMRDSSLKFNSILLKIAHP